MREELRNNPRHLLARHTLATVLDLDGHPDEAKTLLRGLLKEQPEFGDARYLLGKILLAEGEADAAVPHLEAAVRLSPEDASYHYQLAQAYRKLGRSALADRHLALFQSAEGQSAAGGRRESFHHLPGTPDGHRPLGRAASSDIAPAGR